MRARAAIVLALLVALFILPASLAHAAPRHVLAQSDSSSGSGGADAKSGADKNAPPAEEEPGPPWTYQMAWIVIGGTLLLILAIGRMYWRFVASRARGTA
jgi:hypothetical protein